MPDPKLAPSTDKYALDSAQAYGYAKMASDIFSYLQGQEATINYSIEQDEANTE